MNRTHAGSLVVEGSAHPRPSVEMEPLSLGTATGRLEARLFTPPVALGTAILAYPSAIERLSTRESFLPATLAQVGFLTLQVDLLTEAEDSVRQGAHHDVALLADRLGDCARWLDRRGPPSGPLPGCFGVGAAGAAALVLSAAAPSLAGAVVCRAARPDAAGLSLILTRAPVLFITDGCDPVELAANRAACGQSEVRRLEVVAHRGDWGDGAAVDRINALSQAWFARWLLPAATA